MSWLQQQALYQPIPFGLRQYWKGHLVGRLDETLADALIAFASEETNESFALVELIHGRAHRIPESYVSRPAEHDVPPITCRGRRSSRPGRLH